MKLLLLIFFCFITLLIHGRRIKWKLEDPKLSLSNGKLMVSIKGSKEVESLTVKMSVDQKHTKAKDKDLYIFELQCDEDFNCTGVGGPDLFAGNTVFYGMTAHLINKRYMFFSNRKWIVPLEELSTDNDVNKTESLNKSCTNKNRFNRTIRLGTDISSKKSPKFLCNKRRRNNKCQKTELGTGTEIGSKIRNKIGTETVTDSGIESESESRTDSGTESESESKTDSGIESVTESGPESRTDPTLSNLP